MPESDLQLLIRAARDAGDIATRYWRGAPQVWDKPGNQGPVSEADLAVDAALRETLLAARPDYGWLSEETEDNPARLDAENVFIVDPIDGTRAFVAGERTFAHSLAISRNGEIVAGVVYLPARDKLYSAATGQGAYLNDEPIQVSSRGALSGADVLAAKPTFRPEFWQRDPGVTRHFRTSLAYRMCLVAEGAFDAMLTLRDTWHWDIAAGAVIVSEAGGAVTDRTGGHLRFNSPVAQSAGTVAGGQAVHAQTIALLS